MNDKAIANMSEFINSCPKFVDSQTLDLQIFQNLRDAIGDDSFFSDLVNVYKNSSKVYKEAIHVAFTRQDANEFSINAHSLKSISASIGAIRVAQICSFFEKNGKTGEITISVEFLDLLNDEHQRAIAEIDALVLKFMPE